MRRFREHSFAMRVVECSVDACKRGESVEEKVSTFAIMWEDSFVRT